MEDRGELHYFIPLTNPPPSASARPYTPYSTWLILTCVGPLGPRDLLPDSTLFALNQVNIQGAEALFMMTRKEAMTLTCPRSTERLSLTTQSKLTPAYSSCDCICYSFNQRFLSTSCIYSVKSVYLFNVCLSPLDCKFPWFYSPQEYICQINKWKNEGICELLFFTFTCSHFLKLLPCPSLFKSMGGGEWRVERDLP